MFLLSHPIRSILFIFNVFFKRYCRIVCSGKDTTPSLLLSRTYSRVDWLVGLEELFNFRAPAFPEVRSALAANRDLIDGPRPVSVLSLSLYCAPASAVK